jgi:hypothetical protein
MNQNHSELGSVKTFILHNGRKKSYIDYDMVEFEGFDNKNGSSYSFVVPNLVHLIYLNMSEIKFYQAISLYSIYLNQKPDLILIHCDRCNFTGFYWQQMNSINDLRNRIVLKNINTENTIFGKKYGWLTHRSDVLRLLVLMNYGGMYFDHDVYLVNSLDQYRRFEMTAGWEFLDHAKIGSQVLIANKNARFLKAVYDGYR